MLIYCISNIDRALQLRSISCTDGKEHYCPHLTKFALPLKAHAYFRDLADTGHLSSESEC